MSVWSRSTPPLGPTRLFYVGQHKGSETSVCPHFLIWNPFTLSYGFSWCCQCLILSLEDCGTNYDGCELPCSQLGISGFGDVKSVIAHSSAFRLPKMSSLLFPLQFSSQVQASGPHRRFVLLPQGQEERTRFVLLYPPLPAFCLFVFKSGSHYVTHVGLKLNNLMP